MNSFRGTIAAIVAMAAGQVASAQLPEGFEHGNPGLYTSSAGGTFEINTAARHDGGLGAHFGTSSSFFYRGAVATSAGNTYRAWVRIGAASRAYMGVDADAGGAFSVVLSSNTNDLRLQDNTGWGFVELTSVAFTPEVGRWY